MISFKTYLKEIINYYWDRPNPRENISHYEIRVKEGRYNAGKVVGKATSPETARKSLNKHDNKYGAYAHEIIPIYKD